MGGDGLKKGGEELKLRVGGGDTNLFARCSVHYIETRINLSACVLNCSKYSMYIAAIHDTITYT